MFDAYVDLNTFISFAAIITFIGQGIFLVNFFYAIFFGKEAPKNPWKATTLEWTTPVKVKAGNWPGPLPLVYRWAYDYSVPGAEKDYIPQNIPDKISEKKKQKNE
jgi:cytochrome c oxidase subunit 1